MEITNNTNREMRRRRKLSALDTAYVGLSAAFIAICSWISIPTAIPFTLQTFAIFFITALFGLKRGTLAVAVYLLLGIIGLPVFTGFKGGIGVLAGATGGYIVSFLLIAVIVGFVSDRTNGKLLPTAAAMLMGNLLCYLFGSLWFMLVYTSGTEPVSFTAVLSMCVIPFLLPDAVKLAIAALLANRLRKTVKSLEAR